MAGKVTGCDAEDLRRQLRSLHSGNGLDEAVRFSADPFGSVKNLDPAIMGKAPSGPIGRR